MYQYYQRGLVPVQLPAWLKNQVHHKEISGYLEGYQIPLYISNDQLSTMYSEKLTSLSSSSAMIVEMISCWSSTLRGYCFTCLCFMIVEMLSCQQGTLWESSSSLSMIVERISHKPSTSEKLTSLLFFVSMIVEMISNQQSTLWEINFTFMLSSYDSWNDQLSIKSSLRN